MSDLDGVTGPVSLVESVAASVAAATRAGTIKAYDGAAVDLAMRYALQIDQETAAGGARAQHATATLGPLLGQVMKILGCSPAGRMEIAAGPRRRGRPTTAEAEARRRAVAQQAVRDSRG